VGSRLCQDCNRPTLMAPPFHRLSPLLAPRSVAIVGASPRENTLGNNVVVNLRRFGYAGRIMPVHPSAPEVAGLPAYRALSELPVPAECAVLAVPADKIAAALEEGVAHGLRAAVVFASGFAEIGEEGRTRQRQLQELCKRTGIVLCGPNCLGLVNVHERLSLYSSGIPEGMRDGGLAIISHSGSACIALSTLGRFGISHLVSVGNAAVLDVADYLEYLAGSGETKTVALFIETLRDPPAFARAMQAMHDAGKTVVALKVGRSAKGAAASAAHTGALAGNWDAYQAFFRRHGVIAVDDFDELAESVELALKVRVAPRSNGVAVIAVSGGETSLVADLAERAGVHLPELAPDTVTRLRAVLPAFGNIGNPLDITDRGVYDAQNVYSGSVRALADDPAVSLIAVVQDCSPGLSVRGANNYRRIAQTVAEASRELAKPVVFFNTAAGGLHPHVVEPFAGSDVAVMQGARASLLAIGRFFAHAQFTPRDQLRPIAANSGWSARLATGAPFTERESKAFLAAHGIAVTREILARDPQAAVSAAAEIGFPVVLKIESPDLPHKTEVGGVRVGLADAAAVEIGFREIMAAVQANVPAVRPGGVLVQEMVFDGTELIAGLSRQEPFGMGVVCGAGGVLVELMQDSALDLCPIDHAGANALLERTRVGRLMHGYRGRSAADIEAFADLLALLSRIGVAYADLLEAVDLNPVAVLPRGRGAVVLDALVIPRKVTSEERS
jgi:acetate---CoA ligase (ADP-forming)